MKRLHRWLILALVTSTLALGLAAGSASASTSKTSCDLRPHPLGDDRFAWSPAPAPSGFTKTVHLSKEFLGGPSEPQGFSVVASSDLKKDPLPLDGSDWAMKFHVKGEWVTQLPATSNIFDDSLEMHLGLTVGKQAFPIGSASIPLHEPGLPSGDQLLNTPFAYSFDAWLAFSFKPQSAEGGRFDQLGVDYKLSLQSPGISATTGDLKVQFFMDDTHTLFVPAPCNLKPVKSDGFSAELADGTKASPLWGAAAVTAAIGVAGLSFFRSRPPT